MRSRQGKASDCGRVRLVFRAGLGCLACIACIGIAGARGAPAARAGPEPGDDPATLAISFYQKHISSLRHARCPFEPSCSQYALEVIRSRGLLAGAPLVADRLMRCNASAARFYARGPGGRLRDPAGAPAPPRRRPRVPGWLLPAVGDAPPRDPDRSPAAQPRSAAAAPPARDPEATARVAEFLSFADELAREGDCERAATEFARAAHLENTVTLRVWAHLRSGSCFFEQEAWTEAEAQFLEAARLAREAQQSRQARALAAACRFNDGDFAAGRDLAGESDAESLPAAEASAEAPPPLPGQAEQPPPADVDVPARTRALGLQGICDMARGDWDRAQEAFQLGLHLSGETLHPVKLRFLLEKSSQGRELPRRSPGLAGCLSVVVPGSGQMYAGRSQDGLRHLIFNAALLYTVAELARDRHYAAAYLVAGVELPFYLGNIRGGRGAARSFNLAKRMEFVAGVLEQSDR